jgi:hypothetical protein
MTRREATLIALFPTVAAVGFSALLTWHEGHHPNPFIWAALSVPILALFSWEIHDLGRAQGHTVIYHPPEPGSPRVISVEDARAIRDALIRLDRIEGRRGPWSQGSTAWSPPMPRVVPRDPAQGDE